jgi:hypothetical protein
MRTHLKRKQVDDVMGGKEAWANVDKTASEYGARRGIGLGSTARLLSSLDLRFWRELTTV